MNLTIFNFNNQEVRFVGEKPVAKDVALVLGYVEPSNAIYRLVKEKNKGVLDLQTPGGMQSVTVLEEAGIYQLVFSSKLPAAEKFQDWIFEEVLPSIRKTGSYSIQPKLPTSFAEALYLAAQLEEEKQAALLLASQRQEVIEQQLPLVEGFQTTVDVNATYTYEELSKMLQVTKKGKLLGRNNFMSELRAIGLITKKNLPYASYQVWFKVVTKLVGPTSNQFPTTCAQLKAEYIPQFINLLKRNNLVVSYITSNQGEITNV